MEDVTLRGYVCHLRKILREHLQIAQEIDPIPTADRGDLAAYRLDLE
jgi:hypothetical protein